jgi:ElaB/YqjD/DUF883 family membrane-anchored ribosome-binding protein
MGFMSSLKRLFFTTESVAKSAAEKAVEYTKEKAEDLSQSAKEVVSDVTEKTSGLREAVVEKANAAFEKVESVAENAWEKTKDLADDAVDKVKDMTDDKPTSSSSAAIETEFVKPIETPTVTTETTSIFDKVASAGSDLLEKTKDAASSAYETLAQNETVQKAGEMAESVGAKVMEKGSEYAGKAADLSETVGAKVLDASSSAMDKLGDVKDVAMEKAKEVSDQIGKKFDETVDKAEKFMAEENAKPKQEFSDKDLNAGGSLLEGKDDFFSKAAQYAKGDYDAFSEGKITVQENIKTAKENDDTLDLIDDAIIVDDKDPQS